MLYRLKAVWELYKNSGFELSNMDVQNMLALVGLSREAGKKTTIDRLLLHELPSWFHNLDDRHSE